MNKDITHLNYVKENSFTTNEIEKVDFNKKLFIFDTESCQDKEGDNSGARVYGWGLGCINSHKMIYGQSLEEFIMVMKKLLIYDKDIIKVDKVNKTLANGEKELVYPDRKFIKYTIGVHNLSWDSEFLNYALLKMDYVYKKAKIDINLIDGKEVGSAKEVRKPKSFHIIQNDNIVYNMSIFTDKVFEIINKDGSTTNVYLHLDFFDTLKIVTAKVDQFSNYVNNIDDMFYKLKEKYNYKMFRPVGHLQSELELRYQYNDIYMLREVVEQFYIGILLNGDINKVKNLRTASSIAFHKLKINTFGMGCYKTKTKIKTINKVKYKCQYTLLDENFNPIIDEKEVNKAYKEYYGIGIKTDFEVTRTRLENKSYSGGWTHVNHDYVGKILKNINGSSCDVNSSYPSQMSFELLPFSAPYYKELGSVPKYDKNKSVGLFEIGFDFVKPKKDEYNLAVFKLGACNKLLTEKISKSKNLDYMISNNEYFSTNIINGSYVYITKKVDSQELMSNYNMVVTSAEYDFLIKHFDFGVFERNKRGKILSYELIFNGLEIGECILFYAEKGKLKPFVDMCMKGKTDNKPKYDENNNLIWEGNIPLSNSFKLIANSSYGKFATKIERLEKDLVKNDHDLLYFTSENSESYQSKSYYKPIASFITAYGRLKLWNTIIYGINVKYFLYSDTDSIYTLHSKEELEKRLNACGQYVDSKKLGYWDIETEFTSFKAIGQKKYILEAKKYDKKNNYIGTKIKLKCCGLPDEGKINILDEKDPFIEFKLGKEVKGKKSKVKVIGGYLLLDTKFKIQSVMFGA